MCLGFLSSSLCLPVVPPSPSYRWEFAVSIHWGQRKPIIWPTVSLPVVQEFIGQIPPSGNQSSSTHFSVYVSSQVILAEFQICTDPVVGETFHQVYNLSANSCITVLPCIRPNYSGKVVLPLSSLISLLYTAQLMLSWNLAFPIIYQSSKYS